MRSRVAPGAAARGQIGARRPSSSASSRNATVGGGRTNPTLAAGRNIVGSRPSAGQGGRGHSEAKAAGRAGGDPKGAQVPAPPPAQTAASLRRETSVVLDDAVREELLSLFDWCDADHDGKLSATEFAAAQHLIAETGRIDVDEDAALAAFKSAGEEGAACVNQDSFLMAVKPLVSAVRLTITRSELLEGLARQRVRKSSGFGRAAEHLAHSLVRNTSMIADPADVIVPSPPPDLWRTKTGGHSFELPAGVSECVFPAARVGFQMFKFLSGQTEDASFIAPHLASQMVGTRHMFKMMHEHCGDVQGVDVVDSGPPATVDLYLSKSILLGEVFRLRVTRLHAELGPPVRLMGLSGFEPSPISLEEVPENLLMMMQSRRPSDQGNSFNPDLSALGQPPVLSRCTSIAISDSDLQHADLVISSTPISQHRFRIKFALAGRAEPSQHYFLIAPRLRCWGSGHACYSTHDVQVRAGGSRVLTIDEHFEHFVVANVPKGVLSEVVVEHQFTNCRVRVQSRAATGKAQLLEALPLSPEDRALNLADDFHRAEKLRGLLEARGLARRSCERDIAFAVRLGRALRNGYRFDAGATEANLHRLATLIWEDYCGDCSAFNAGFVYALRAFGVPAHVSLGFKYGHAVQQACGSFVATHAQCEFYAEGIGWVPCDATLGVKRLGHEAGSQLSFVEWRPAGQSLAEAAEMARVLSSPAGAESLQRKFEQVFTQVSGDGAGRSTTVRPVSAGSLAKGLQRVEGLTMDAASLRAGQIMSLCDFDEDGRVARDEFVRGMASIELGKRGESLAIGDPLSATAQAGVKMFEGGPYHSGRPLELSKLRENMMVMDTIEHVMDHVGLSSTSKDWANMWPYGVFMCSYDFAEQGL